jgi:serine/threonine protein kinase
LLQRFQQEYKVASTLEHPNIIRALDFGQEGTTYYLVMEFVDGLSLGRRLEREGRMPELDAIRLIAQVAQALHKAHKQGVYHRDVKPDNILLASDGQAKLADLGLAKDMETDLNLTRTGRGLGTPHFMAPEQFRDAKNADRQCDIYSLGATLYMMITGELPFRSCSPLDAWMKKMHNDFPAPKSLVPTISDRVDWAIRRAMSSDPKMRPETCREFVEDLTGRSTRKTMPCDSSVLNQDVWHVAYVDDTGEEHSAKGSLTTIRRALKEGLLGDAENVRVSKGKGGPFEALRTHPEFRDLVIDPSAAPPPAKPAPEKAASRSSLPSVNGSGSYSRLPAARRSSQTPIPGPQLAIGPVEPARPSGNSDRLQILVALLVTAGAFLAGLYFLFHR